MHGITSEYLRLRQRDWGDTGRIHVSVIAVGFERPEEATAKTRYWPSPTDLLAEKLFLVV
jgi:hypothetical protein